MSRHCPPIVIRTPLVTLLVATLAAPLPTLASVLVDEPKCRDLASAQGSRKGGTGVEEVRNLMREGVRLACLGRRNEALTAFQRVVALDPGAAAAYNNIAALHAAEGRIDEARSALESALKTNETYSAAYENLSAIYLHQSAQAYRSALATARPPKVAPPSLSLVLPEDQAATAARSAQPAERLAAARIAPANDTPAAGRGATATDVPVAVRGSATKEGPSAARAAPGNEATAPARAASTVRSSADPRPASNGDVPAAVRGGAGDSSGIALRTPADERPASAQPAPVSGGSPDSDAVRTAIQSWADAWSSRDFDAYLAAYAPDFAGRAPTREAWVSERKLRIVPRKSISVSLASLDIAVSGEFARAVFQQHYLSDGRDIRSRKKLELARINGKWIIVGESSN